MSNVEIPISNNYSNPNSQYSGIYYNIESLVLCLAMRSRQQIANAPTGLRIRVSRSMRSAT